MIINLFLIWISILPLVFFGGVFEGLKIYFFWLGSFFLTLYWLTVKRNKLPKVLNKYDLFYWLWIAILSLSSFLGEDKVNSFLGGSYRHQGVIFFMSLWLVGKTIKLLKEKEKLRFIKYFTWSYLLEIILIFVQFVFGFMTINGRPIGTFGEANAIAGFLLAGTFFVKHKLLLILSFLATLLTQSRTGIAIFILNFVSIPLVLVGVGFILIFSIFRPFNSPYKFEDRLLNTKLAVNAISQKPVLGYGAESTEIIYEKEFKKMGIDLQDLMIDRSHNLILDVALWSGALGLTLFLVWLIGSLKLIFKANEKKKLISLISLLIFAFFQPLGVIHWLLLFLMINW